MKKQLTHSLFALVLVGAGALGAMQITTADAFNAQEDQENQEAQEVKETRRALMEKVTRTVENIQNGAVITLTTADSEALEMLQNGPENQAPLPDGVERSVENLSNGVRITLTSDDEEEVLRIQEHANEDPKERGQGGQGKGEPGWMNGSVEESIEILDNGVRITLTSDDEEVVKLLQERAQHRHEKHDEKRTSNQESHGMRQE